MGKSSNLKVVPDDELLRRLSDLVGRSRRVDADVVEHIAEVDGRKLYAREAVPSMFAYCVQALRLTEFEAYLRITAGRASREHPMLLAMLRDGRLHLTAVARLASHLTPENSETLLNRAAHNSKREIEKLIAELDPKPDVRAAIRKFPDRSLQVTRAGPGGSRLRARVSTSRGFAGGTARGVRRYRGPGELDSTFRRQALSLRWRLRPSHGPLLPFPGRSSA